jgi:siroheme synthase-like protein
MSYYPVNLNLQDKCCLVVGGGEVAARKIKTLLQFGALVSVVAPEIDSEILDLSRTSRLVVKTGEFIPGDWPGIWLVIAATDDARANEAVSVWARQNHILVNVADNPALSDFILPAVVRRGDLLISICSCGKAPALSKKLRQDLDEVLPQDLAELLDKAGIFRERLKTKVDDICRRKQKLADLWNDA